MARGDRDIGPILEAMAAADLLEFGATLDQRVRVGKATLEDFGTLARVQYELARRSDGATEPSSLQAAPDG